MIALIRARFPDPSVFEVWTDAVAANFMDPAIPFSLAHYWALSTFRQVDLSSTSFPAVVVKDPRKNDKDDRTRLVEAVLAEVDRVSKPDWNLFDRCVIVFGHPMDTFGGGSFTAPNGKRVMAAVFNVANRFDTACQEVGHAFGLGHEWDVSGNNEYACPYSVMSAESDLTDTRPPDPRLPGLQGTTHPQRTIGPYLPTVHLYLNQYRPVNPNGVFNHPDTVAYVPHSYEQTPVTVRLVARDAAIAAWPSRRIVLVVIPSTLPRGDTYFLELRRRDPLYDSGIGNACVIITAANFWAGNYTVSDISSLRIRYIDRIDLQGVQGDWDYHSFSGHFVVRVNAASDDFGAVNLTVGGGNAWQNFSVTLTNPAFNKPRVGVTEWARAAVAPCPMWAPRQYAYRVITFDSFYVFQARSVGYEQPSYAWYVENVRLGPASNGVVPLNVPCRRVNGHELEPRAVHQVLLNFNINGGRLELLTVASFAEITLTLRVEVGESSPSVMKNYYPDRYAITTLRVDNLAIEWDAEFQEASMACWKSYADAHRRFQLPRFVRRDPRRDPAPPWDQQIGVRDLIRDLAARDQHAAHAVAAEVARRAGVLTEDVLADAFVAPEFDRGPR